MSDVLADFSKVLIALFSLAIVSVIVANGQAASFVGALGQFLVAMVNKVENAGATASASTSTTPVTTPLPTAGSMVAPGLGGIGAA